MTTADIIIIGGGPGGYETALSAAKAGLAVVLVEADKLGGTCLNEGCIPTKCLCRSAEVLDLCKAAEPFGVECAGVNFDIIKAQERKNQIVEGLKGGIAALMATANVQVVYGRAKFADSKTITVDGATTPDGAPADSSCTAKNIIIATGSQTKFLPIEGTHLDGVLTSRELLNVESVPESLCIIGGGVIGIEFASIFSSFGTKVTVVEYCKEILPNFDSELSKRLRTVLKRRGVDFQMGAAVTGIAPSDGGKLRVAFTAKNKESGVEADKVLMAVGRSANLDSLNLSGIGIATDRRGIVVDENFRTSVDGVYAVGDINGICQLAHAAKFQGQRALNNILGRVDVLNFEVIPAAVFTNPEFAMVGKTEDACQADGTECEVRKSFFRANGKSLALGNAEGLAKFVVAPDGTILGCHVLGPHASDLIEEVAVAMQAHVKLCDLAQTVHAHPTLCEVIGDAAAL